MKSSIVKDKSYMFALEIIRLARRLRKGHEYEIAGQLLDAGTSIGANVEEALAGVSRADFVAKMAIASKEARETHYWLRLVRDSKTLAPELVNPTLKQAEELLRILTAIVKTTQNRNNLKLRTQNSKLKTPSDTHGDREDQPSKNSDNSTLKTKNSKLCDENVQPQPTQQRHSKL